MKYTNPVISGFYPDPSVCMAKDSFYLVCSSFQYFPGIPIFQSEDMVNWKQIGHCLTRKSQLDLTKSKASCGLFAPTIRYNNGRFYVVVTNVNNNENFYVYTDDIYGEWSEPIKVNRGGIDPSLLFCEDKAYFISNGEDDYGENGVSLCEINIESGEIIGKAKCICKGSGGRFIEAPHLYRIGEYYYLLVAEGGTEYGHMECLFRSRDPFGQYESCPSNPVLTNRNLGGYTIQGAGHADIVEDKNGQWWMVNLAFRQINDWRQYHTLGREVYLEPIYWNEKGWFTVGTDGTCRKGYIVENGKCFALEDVNYFYAEEYKWKLIKEQACFIRSPNYENYVFKENSIMLKGTQNKLSSMENVTFAGMRQKEFNFSAEIEINTSELPEGRKCGLTAYMDENNHFDAFAENDGGLIIISGELTIGGIKTICDRFKTKEKKIDLKIIGKSQSYTAYSEIGQSHMLFHAQSKYLSTEVCEGFTGVIIGVFCEDKKDIAQMTEITVK